MRLWEIYGNVRSDEDFSGASAYDLRWGESIEFDGGPHVPSIRA